MLLVPDFARPHCTRTPATRQDASSVSRISGVSSVNRGAGLVLVLIVKRFAYHEGLLLRAKALLSLLDRPVD
ncbi:hypothetical protein BURKHO8Y_460012 [Burkholderia sp. 8Y]|nr:hypothetical protein BURKHO8Y_460012 [Burkholderia sp. 8Y]